MKKVLIGFSTTTYAPFFLQILKTKKKLANERREVRGPRPRVPVELQTGHLKVIDGQKKRDAEDQVKQRKTSLNDLLLG